MKAIMVEFDFCDSGSEEIRVWESDWQVYCFLSCGIWGKMATTLRSLKIKTSTCKRILKELHSYEKEVETEAAKTAKMKDNGADPYDLKQQVFPSPLQFSIFFC